MTLSSSDTAASAVSPEKADKDMWGVLEVNLITAMASLYICFKGAEMNYNPSQFPHVPSAIKGHLSNTFDVVLYGAVIDNALIGLSKLEKKIFPKCPSRNLLNEVNRL